ncbi:MAG: hypothetical protein WCO62_00360 [Betaproteobacteria bacterium]
MKKQEHNDKKPTSSGGVTNEMRKKYGRNIARIVNQTGHHKTGGRGR